MADEAAISVWELAGGLDAPAAARRLVHQTLEGLVGDEALATVVLLTSEIVTNAIVRGGSGAVVTLEVNASTIVTTVADGRPDSPALTGLAQAVVEDRNLSWGAHVHRSGKAVWFEVAHDLAPSIAEGGAEAGTVHP